MDPIIDIHLRPVLLLGSGVGKTFVPTTSRWCKPSFTLLSMSLSSHVSLALPSEHVPPPPTLVKDDSTARDAVRQRLAPKSRLSRVFSLPRLRLQRTSSSTKSLTRDPRLSEPLAEAGTSIQEEPPAITTASTLESAPITLDDNSIKGKDDETKDRYEWAIVYENQRGATLFSIPYYSALSLLPTDPSAFTLPNASSRRSEQPPITLATYPLPDGNWRWVSRAWMIDMRSNSGIVQHDGFEYNWVFRRHNWRAQVGFLSAGGWVRRRRWVRLMMRPAKNKTHIETQGTASSSSTSSRNNLLRHSMTSSNLTGLSEFPHTLVESVWFGNDNDWKRCRSLMLRYAQDGRKLDLWRTWLGYYHPAYRDQFTDLVNVGKGKGKQKQWTEDDGPLPSQLLEPDAASYRSMTPPPREYIAPVLHRHGRDLLQIFVYPDSRVQFLRLLGKAGLLPDLRINIGSDFNTSEVEFWSYTSDLEEPKHLDIRDTSPTPNTSTSLLLASHQLSDGE
ncbi:hypothetical protein AN958_05031 [Leucoagaricus sp. SymC.cos]|nr:hypothetical protein AN958_05031 [Leucoagaricus sp. SymC.cos]